MKNPSHVNAAASPANPMSIAQRTVSVCICTCMRAGMLARLLDSIEAQLVRPGLSFEVVVADNDVHESARATVEAFAQRSRWPVRYVVEPRRNIALARNAALRAARGDRVAFVDDDEFAQPDWLLRMLDALDTYGCAAVLGPVRPHFDSPPPAWIIKGAFCERAEHATGHVMDPASCRTGNVMLERRLFAGVSSPFLEQFGSGGEDKDFFLRMHEQGHVFRWCNEAAVYETVPPSRWTRRYMLQRALLRGNNNLKLSGQRTRLLATSVVAAPVYAVLLPLTLAFGQHVFMHCCIRLCDHAGRLLGAVGLNPVKAR